MVELLDLCFTLGYLLSDSACKWLFAVDPLLGLLPGVAIRSYLVFAAVVVLVLAYVRQ